MALGAVSWLEEGRTIGERTCVRNRASEIAPQDNRWRYLLWARSFSSRILPVARPYPSMRSACVPQLRETFCELDEGRWFLDSACKPHTHTVGRPYLRWDSRT